MMWGLVTALNLALSVILMARLQMFVTACDCHHPDFVSHLPGYDPQPAPAPWFSGYVEYSFHDRTIRTHYVLVQAERDYSRTKPIIYWSNGGPGASSLFGLLTELGPLQLSDESLATPQYRSTGIPTLLYNPYAWTRLGSVLVFDQPAPVGFSYCTKDAGAADSNDGDDDNGKNCEGLSWTDELAAENAHRALQAFYDKFPCYNSTDLYLTGESYGGIYIPTLARRILNEKRGRILNDEGEDRHDLRGLLRGIAVGDGCLGTQTGICGELSPNSHEPDIWRVLFLAGHGQIPFSTFQKVLFACRAVDARGDGGEVTILGYDRWATDDDDCKAALTKVKEQVGGYFEYSLYDDCIYRNLAIETVAANAAGVSSSSPPPGPSRVRGGLNDYPCGGYPVMVEWLNRDDVKRALHLHGSFFSVDNAQNFDYTPTEPDLTGFFRHLAAETPIRVLIYNGDTDPSITSLEGQNWTSSLGLPEVQPWRPWSIDSCLRVGGYVTRYEGDFDFLTVRGSGHMVPTYKAEATFAFLQAWIENRDYPRYNPTCTKPTTFSSSRTVPSDSSLSF
jgi:hypothetical protein